MIEIDKKYMLKENLIIVKVENIRLEHRGRKKEEIYEVYYPHLEKHRTFSVKEEELQEIPIDYNQIIYNAYLEYKYKYEDLLKRLYSPNVREKY